MTPAGCEVGSPLRAPVPLAPAFGCAAGPGGASYESVGGARHASERENDPRHREAIRFARRIARRLDEARRKDEFKQLIVVAGPAFLGLMRQEMSRPTRARVVHEVHKDLVHSPVDALRRHLPASAAEMSSH